MADCHILTSLTVLTPPVTAALDLSDLKKRLRWQTDSEDDILDGWIRAATAHFEEQTGRPVIETEYAYSLAGFPYGVIELPRPPLRDVESVEYVGSDGTLVTLDEDSYTLHKPQGDYCPRGWIQLNSGFSWPTGLNSPGSVVVTFTAGYGQEPSEVPELVKTTIQLLVGQFHKYRANTVETRQTQALTLLPIGVDQFISAFKFTALPTKPPMWGPSWV